MAVKTQPWTVLPKIHHAVPFDNLFTVTFSLSH